jgi:hypothetical protein
MIQPAPATADAAVSISTDRPSVADYSPIVPVGALQIESGLLTTETDSLTTLDLPEVLLRYGLLAKTELRLTLPDYFWNFPHCSNTNASVVPTVFSHTTGGCAGTNGTQSGFGDMAIGLKQHLGGLGGFDFLLIPTLSFPTGARQFTSGGYDPGLMLPWSRSLSANWTVAGQFAAYWPTQDGSRNDTKEATLLFDRQLTAPWDAFIEYVGDFPQRGGSRQLLHVGTAYKLAPNQQVDFHAAVGLSEAAPKYYVGFGYSYLLLTR